MNDFTFTKEAFFSIHLENIRRNGTLEGIGKPETLKNHPGYSRRIDKENRLVYVIDELKNIKVISCKGHYTD